MIFLCAYPHITLSIERDPEFSLVTSLLSITLYVGQNTRSISVEIHGKKEFIGSAYTVIMSSGVYTFENLFLT